MTIRIAALLGLSFALVAGTIAVAQRMSVAQVAPQAPAVADTAAPAAQQPPDTQAAPVPSAPVPDAAPVAPPPAPVVTAPPAAAAPSIVAVPPAPEVPPVAIAPPPASVPPATIAPPLPPVKPAIAEPKPGAIPAKTLFGAEKLPTLGKAMAIGYYPRGCLSGGVALPVTGPTWQVMRVSRNRNWGHPSLVRYLEKFAPRAAKATGWKGILVGDLAQPRGGPTPFGHRSHQTGLDVDIWFMPMPSHVLSKEERENISAPNVVAADWKSLNPKFWTPQHIAFIKTAAEQPEVERVLVNAAIKKEICRVEGRNKNGWMTKVRPWYGHHDHIHVRLKCPADSPNCRAQPPVPGDDGCSEQALAHWFSDKVLNPPKPTKPAKPPRALTMADLPPACKTVLSAPAKTVRAGLP